MPFAIISGAMPAKPGIRPPLTASNAQIGEHVLISERGGPRSVVGLAHDLMVTGGKRTWM
jgi:hypothetical protein